MDGLLSGDIGGLLHAYRERRVSPVEVTRAVLQRIEQTARLNAFIAVLAESALSEAQAAEACYARGTPAAAGALCGVPVSVKDLFDVRGQANTGGSLLFGGRAAAADSAVVSRLRRAGAVLVGRTNLHELALGTTTENPHFGPVRNPWDAGRVAGGSSGGSAVSVAVGSSFASMGTDTGGSVRIPAALCGVVGLKPTYGRVSRRGVTPLSWSLDHPGVLARTPADAMAVLRVVAGPDPADDTTLHQPEMTAAPTGDPGPGLAGLRVGRPRQFFFDRLDPEVRAAVDGALARMEQAGAVVVEVDLPHLEVAPAAQACILLSEAAALHRADVQRRPAAFGADVLARLQAGMLYTAVEYVDALRVRRLVRDELRAAFGSVDVLAAPTAAVPAFPIGSDRVRVDQVDEDARLVLNRLTGPWNLAGLPAVSLPCGLTRAGLPVGLQFAADHFREDVALRAAVGWRALHPWTMPPATAG